MHEAAIARMRARGADLIGEMQYGDSYRLAYIRGPEGIIVGLAEDIGKAPPLKKKVARTRPVSRAKPAGRKKAARKVGEARKKR